MAKDILYVIDGKQKIPFLRGMMTHSLIGRGLSFEEAYQTATSIRDQVGPKGEIRKEELSQLIDSVLPEDSRQGGAKKDSPIGVSRTILVKDEDSVTPFSKGVLSQSLQASGLEPSVSYDIARETEAYLLGKDPTEVTRDELRRLIYETIMQNHDRKFAERYLLWRCFKSPDKPLIILFGGATGTGKSSIAAEVAYRLGIQKIVSTDTIRQIMRMMFSKDLMPAIHYSSYEAWKDISWLEGDPSGAVVEAFRQQALLVLVGVKAMTERAIQENSSVVVDGVHLVPGLIDLEEFEDKAYIVPLVISTLNQGNYLKRFPSRQRQASNRVAHRYRENFKYILEIQDYILEMADRHVTPISENDNLDDTVAPILTVISHSLQQKLKIRSEDLVTRAL